MSLLLSTETNPGNAKWQNASLFGSVFWGFPVACSDQLSDGSIDPTMPNAIRSAIVIQLANSPQAGDKLIFRYEEGGVTFTETYTVIPSGNIPGPFQVPSGGADGVPAVEAFIKSLDEALIVNNSAYRLCSTFGLLIELDPISGDPIKLAYSLKRLRQNLPSYNDRLYGTISAIAEFKYVDYRNANEAVYAYVTVSPLPTTDPGEQTFGPSRTTLFASEIHVRLPKSRTDKYQPYFWDGLTSTWLQVPLAFP